MYPINHQHIHHRRSKSKKVRNANKDAADLFGTSGSVSANERLKLHEQAISIRAPEDQIREQQQLLALQWKELRAVEKVLDARSGRNATASLQG